LTSQLLGVVYIGAFVAVAVAASMLAAKVVFRFIGHPTKS
jgi:hypothetical protein